MSRQFMIFVLSIIGVTSIGAAEIPLGTDRAPLSFEERVTAFEKVENVYWSYRIWPQENPTAKPARDEVMSHEQVVAKVEKFQLYEAALEQIWEEPLTPQRIQAELDRIARSTQHPELLNDIFTALSQNPYLIAECFVRPRLAERLVRERYAWDSEIHRQTREQAEAELLGASRVADLEHTTASMGEVSWVRDDAGVFDEPTGHDELRLTPGEWNETTIRLAGRFPSAAAPTPAAFHRSNPGEQLTAQVGWGVSPLFETTGAFGVVEVLAADDGSAHIASATWPKRTFADWLQNAQAELRPTTSNVGSYALPKLASGDPCIDDTWTPTAGSGPPAARSGHKAVWTGTEMIVWGGGDTASYLDNGGRYDPVTDSWLPISTSGAPAARSGHSAVWTGAEMIVWGGEDGTTSLNTGGRYDPDSDSWTGMTSAGAPTIRNYHHAVWTGSEMIIWGGRDGAVYTNTGGIYDPATDSWTPTTTTGAPSGRTFGAAAWTGDEMIVWGGWNGTTSLGSGGRYDPSTDSWTATSTTGAPGSRYYHHGVWTGDEMIVWGGHNGASMLTSGGRYDPTTDSWTATSTTGAPSGRYTHATVWTGDEMIVWGGYNGVSMLNTGGRYDPATDSWTATSSTAAPSSRRGHSAVWTGDEMIVWGGWNNPTCFNTGGRYDPATDSWVATSASGALAPRHNHRAVWTGTEMVVWGGYDTIAASHLDTGGLYDPATDSWVATSATNAPSPRAGFAAAWTGTEMIVWGGYGGSNLNTGGRYDPAADTWTATTTSGAPQGRYNLTGLWTGTEMIVWGGWNNSTVTASGGRYDPAADSWTPTATSGAPSARQLHTAVWTGTEMIIWAGALPTTGTGGRYDPTTDSWTPTSSSALAVARYYHEAVWTGTEMIVWGGYDGSSAMTAGCRYDPATDSWAATSPTDEPAARRLNALVWTGTEMIAWGGDDKVSYLDTGGRYDPVADSWAATSTIGTPAGRSYFPAVWTGTGAEMIVWGGYDGASVDTGGRYCASGVLGIDFGDAPDPTYPTLLASDGARHPNFGLLYLGSTVDGEADGQPTAGADGDDNDAGGDDEDGVTFTSLLIPGETAGVDVQVSDSCYLNAWIDFNGDGDWADAFEQIYSDHTLTTGTNSLTFSVPASAPPSGITITRFRVDSTGGLGTTGLATDGEVEDSLATIEELDYGDAADPSYPTLLASDGARHLLGGSLYLGASVDVDADGQPTSGADGDDLDGVDDEDGVTLPSSLPGGTTSEINITASAPGLLNAWTDFNSDGDWLDAGEQIFTDEAVLTGSNALDVSVPLTATPGSTTMRFRLDSSGGLAPTGLAMDGEVEDYAITIDPWADLSLGTHESLDPVVENSQFSYFVTVSNNGPLDATGVVLTDTLDANVSFIAANLPACGEASGVVTCALDPIPSGTSTQVEIEVEAVAGFTGTLTNTASVVLDQPDPITTNNDDTEETEVIDAAVYIFSDGFETGDTSRWST
ncbi:MAG: DUF11 domain-containing protein [bacterium]|nr:DUF11 domain-containing protein [bacterium]